MGKANKFIDLSNLERTSQRIMWHKSVGKELYFEYGDISGYVKIVSYNKDTLKVDVEYNGRITTIKTYSLSQCQLARVLNKYNSDFKVEINDKINNLIILDREVRLENNGKRRKYYKYKCEICKFENWIEEANLLKGIGCSCCAHQVVVPNVNTISVTAPWMAKYILNKEDIYKYTSQNERVIQFKCPDCGYIKKMRINNVYNQGFSCSKCSDGIKYPEKFMINILSELKIEYIRELSKKDFEWCGSYRYDFYLPKYNMIIEVHGKQHYEYTGWRDVRDQQRIDKEKKHLAISNGISEYISLDCRESTPNFIKSSIMNSKLVDYFSFENINWEKNHKLALNNLIKEVCEYYETHDKNIKRQILCNMFNIKSSKTLIKYLRIGTELGWCKYENKAKKRVMVIELNEVFETIKECVENLNERLDEKFNASGVIGVCKGKLESYKGFHFKYV